MKFNSLTCASALVLLGMAATPAFAKTNTWTSASQVGHWSEASNWAENRTLESGDCVLVKDSLTATMNDADIAAMNGLLSAIIMPGSGKGTLVFDVTGDDNVVTYMINTSGNDTTGQYSFSTKIVKNGTGMVTLNPATHGNSTYGASVFVNNGTLKMPQHSSNYNLQIPALTVNSPGVLVLMAGCADAGCYALDGVFGDGVLTNPSPSNISHIYVGGSSVFRGKIYGNVAIRNDTTQTFTGEFRTTEVTSGSENSFSGNSLFGLESIGGTSPDKTTVKYGSIGKGTICFRMNPGIRYLGAGETAYPYIYALAIAESFTYDGGPYGGLELGNTISFSGATGMVTTLILRGTNAAPCVLNGNFYATSKGGTTNLRKDESGTWRIPATANASFGGLVAVRDGTLQFGSLQNTGIACSLGLANNLADDVKFSGILPDSLRVSYAWLLGNTPQGKNATTGTLEYVGTENAFCVDRTLAVRGVGRVTSSAGNLSLVGATSAALGANTLILDGESGTVSEYADLADGTQGTLAVVKQGAGTWRLGGNLAFSGGIEVKEGTLEIGKTPQYQFYRAEFKERVEKGLDSSTFYICKLALFNSEGVMQNVGLVDNTSARNSPWLLKAGECALQTLSGHSYWTDANTVTNIFRNVTQGTYMLNALDSYYYYGKSTKHPTEEQLGYYPWLDDSESWVTVYFRLPANADHVVTYDVGARFPSSNAAWVRQPYSWTLSGSRDGRTWTELSTVISNAPPANSCSWYSNGKSFSEASDGWAITTCGTTSFASATAATVAPEATLRTTESVTINSLSAKTTEGLGTIDGFTLAATGTLNLTGSGRLQPMTLPATVSNCTGDLSGWSVNYNGTSMKSTWKLRLTAGGIEISAKGLTIYVR